MQLRTASRLGDEELVLANGLSRVALEPVGGAMPLDSRFYIERRADREFHAALTRKESVVLLKGGRQMGKTSLLARGLARARQWGALVVLTDFQKLNAVDLTGAEAFFKTLISWVADRADLDVSVDEFWDERQGPAMNFERFMVQEVIRDGKRPVVWAMDEVDRLFSCPFASEVFGLFRSWHNERANDPGSPWAHLTLAISYATEAYLFVTDQNLSPFNVGTRLELQDFTQEEVAELNRRYGSPLRSAADLDRFFQLVGGQPFLVRRSLHEMVTNPSSLAQFATRASLDEGIFGDHLRRIALLLSRNQRLMEAVQQVLTGQPCSSLDSLRRLCSAGVLVSAAGRGVRPRCQLYADYLLRHVTA